MILNSCIESSTETENSLPPPSIDSSLIVGDYKFVAKKDSLEAKPTSLGDASLNAYFQLIYESKHFVQHDDDHVALTITDSLFAKTQGQDHFYFVVFTRSLNGADGFYSEAAGKAAYTFVIKETERFAEFFTDSKELSSTDLRNWASMINGEIQIVSEGRAKEARKKLHDRLRDNIQTSNQANRNMIESFINELTATTPIK